MELIELVAPRVVPMPLVVFGRGGGNRVSRLTDLIDFFQSYAGRALETLKVDRNGASVTTAPENVNVKLLGAMGDGVTNDTVAIQAAIDRLPAAGGTVFFPPGTYVVSATLALPDKPVKLVGSGRGSTVINLGSNAIAAFQYVQTPASEQNILFQDFTINGDGTVGQRGLRSVDGNATRRSIFHFFGMAFRLVETMVYDEGSLRMYFSECDFIHPDIANAILYDGPIANEERGSLFFANCFESTDTAIATNRRGGVKNKPTINAVQSDFAVGTQWISHRTNLIDCNVLGSDLTLANNRMKINQGSLGASRILGSRFTFNCGLELRVNTTTVEGNFFFGDTAGHKAIIVQGVNHAIKGNAIQLPAGFTGIEVDGATSCSIEGNVATESISIVEINAANDNQYDDNAGFAFTLIGALSSLNNEQTRVVSTTPYAVVDTDRSLLVDATGGAITVNLPTAASAKWRVLTVKKIDASANAVTIDGSGGETIDDSPTRVLAAQYNSAMIQSDGTEWWVLAS
jgi:hypothetical protein